MEQGKKLTDKTAVTPTFRVSFPHVFEPVQNDMGEKTKMEYTVQALFPKDADLTVLKKMCMEAAVKKFGKKEKWPKDQHGNHRVRFPFRDQGDREKEKDGKTFLPDGYEAGAVYMNLKSTRRPKVLDRDKSVIDDPEKFYAGCYARALVSCFAYKVKGNVGVTFGLEGLQFVKDGDPLSGRPRVEEAFEALEVGFDSEGEDAGEELDDLM